jgi:hypothetical protein
LRGALPARVAAAEMGYGDQIRFSFFRFRGWGLVNEFESKKRT